MFDMRYWPTDPLDGLDNFWFPSVEKALGMILPDDTDWK